MLFYKIRNINYYILSLFAILFFHIIFVLFFINSKNKKIIESLPIHFPSFYPKKYLQYIKKNEHISNICPYRKNVFIWTRVPKIIINNIVFYSNGLGIPISWFDKIPVKNTIDSKIDIVEYDLDLLKNIIKLIKSINCFFQNSKIKIIDFSKVKIKISDNEFLLMYPWQKFDKTMFNSLSKIKNYIDKNQNILNKNQNFINCYDLRLFKSKKIIYKQKIIKNKRGFYELF
jgi:hypothetical protein